jgi:hypothetical protein
MRDAGLQPRLLVPVVGDVPPIGIGTEVALDFLLRDRLAARRVGAVATWARSAASSSAL